MFRPEDALVGAEDRRRTPRLPCPGEITLAWLHDPATPIRLTLINVSDGGLRVRSSLPVLDGTTGVAMRLLPEGRPIDRAVSVSWCRADEAGGWQIGLRFLR